MENYNICYAHEDGVGPYPYLLGVNYSRMGMSKEKMLRGYSKSAYSEDFFHSLNKGYDESDSVSLNTVAYKKDTIYIFHRLLRNRLLADLISSEITYEESSGDSYFINGQGSTTSIRLIHKRKDIVFRVEFCETLHVDGSHGCHWSVDVEVGARSDVSIATIRHFSANQNWRVEYGNKNYSFHNCGSALIVNGKLILSSIQHHRAGGKLPSSEVIALLLCKIIEGLSGVIVDATTSGVNK